MKDRVARVAMTNVYMGGDYTGKIFVGPEAKPMNVILDTGSSALAVNGRKYRPDFAAGDRSTRLAQTDSYDDGSSWTGAVIRTDIAIGDQSSKFVLRDGNAAIAYAASSDMFGQTDGILGLAYAPLDDAFRMKKDTWQKKYAAATVRAGAKATLVPYLTQLADEGITSDIMSFITHRSTVHIGGGGEHDPLNIGWMFVGQDRAIARLARNAKSVKVLSDDWYSTNLRRVVVGNSAPIAARLHGPKGGASNSIVDSGTNSLDISPQLLHAMLTKFTPAQQKLLNRAIAGHDVPMNRLDLDNWPSLTFVLEGTNGEDASIKVAPTDYWQVNTDKIGRAALSITSGDPGSTTLGLPAMNGYFTIFDGEADHGRGVVRFASKKDAMARLLADTVA